MLLKFIIKDFLADRKLKNLSTKSLESYDRTLTEFHNFCVEREAVNVEDVSAVAEMIQCH